MHATQPMEHVTRQEWATDQTHSAVAKTPGAVGIAKVEAEAAAVAAVVAAEGQTEVMMTTLSTSSSRT